MNPKPQAVRIAIDGTVDIVGDDGWPYIPDDDADNFVWLGVTMYLSVEAIRTTLNFIAEQACPTQVVADYLYPISAAEPEDRAAFETFAELIAELGEPFSSYFTAEETEKELRSAGFDAVEDFSAPALLDKYLGRLGAQDDSASGGLMSVHIVRASALSR